MDYSHTHDIQLIYGSQSFEYDEQKSLINEEKHGISFEEAQELWDDPNYYEVKLEFKGERRTAVLARWEGTYWTAITTMRGTSIRIISVRRSTQEEKRLYDRAFNERQLRLL